MIQLKPDNGWIAFDSNGVRYPWLTAGALEILDKMDLTKKFIWEYGCGHSTLWFRSRGANVRGVDSNTEWAELAGVDFAGTKDTYINSIHEYNEKFDIIVIDGIYRDECTLPALNEIEKGGIIIIDNFEQESAGFKEWPLTKALFTERKLPNTLYRETLHEDWGTLIIQC